VSDALRAMSRVVLASSLLVGLACSSGGNGGGSAADPCPIVEWYADTSGSVSEPSDVPVGLDQAQALADSLPDAEGQAFMQLWDDLMSNMSDAAYSSEAASFEATYC
jgi:hypothetical protein